MKQDYKPNRVKYLMVVKTLISCLKFLQRSFDDFIHITDLQIAAAII